MERHLDVRLDSLSAWRQTAFQQGRMTMRFGWMIAAALAASCAMPAGAAPVMKRFEILATNFQSYDIGGRFPFTAVFGAFDVTFDPTVAVSYQPIDRLVALPFSLNDQVVYSYEPQFDRIYISTGHNLYPINGNKFLASFDNASSEQFTAGSFAYTFQSRPREFFAAETVTSGAVPEPATWAMMLVGFGMAGFSLRRRKARVTPTVSYA